MKLLLVQPPDPFIHQRYPPLSLAYLAAVAESLGWTVEVAIASNINPATGQEQIRKQAAHFCPDIIAISILTFSAKISYSLINSLAGPGRVIIAGGPHVSILADEALSRSSCDIVVRGEGEETLAELLIAHETTNKNLEKISGISFKKLDGKIVHNSDRPPLSEEQLNALPFPAKHLFLNKHFNTVNFGNISAGRGCPFSCTFCSQSVFKKTHRRRSPERVLAEMEELSRRYGINHFYFVDDIFTLRQEWIEEFCETIIKRNLAISWYCFSRIDGVDEALLKTMQRAGCLFIIYGVESVNPYSLKQIQKKVTLEEIKRVLAITHHAGLGIFLALIWGFPWETPEDADRLIEFIKEVYPWVYFIDLNRIVVFPGTELYATYSQEYNFKDWWFNNDVVNRKLHLYQQLRCYYPNSKHPFFPLSLEVTKKMNRAYTFIDERLIETSTIIRRRQGRYVAVEQNSATRSLSFKFKRLIKLSFIRSSIALAAYAPNIELKFLVPLYKLTESTGHKLQALIAFFAFYVQRNKKEGRL